MAFRAVGGLEGEGIVIGDGPCSVTAQLLGHGNGEKHLTQRQNASLAAQGSQRSQRE